MLKYSKITVCDRNHQKQIDFKFVALAQKDPRNNKKMFENFCVELKDL